MHHDYVGNVILVSSKSNVGCIKHILLLQKRHMQAIFFILKQSKHQ